MAVLFTFESLAPVEEVVVEHFTIVYWSVIIVAETVELMLVQGG